MKTVVCATDPSDETQVRTMVCDNGQTVEAIIHRSNTKTLHVTTTTSNFVIKRLIRDGNVLVDVPGFADKPLVTCETVEFNLTVIGFFTPAAT
jgi:hypothetical protein